MLDLDYDYLNNTTADMRLMGVPNIMSPFSQFNSAPRVAMFNHHLPQTMIIDKPEFNKAFTGVEHSFLEYTFNPSRREHDVEIVAVIPKYLSNLVKEDVCPQYYVICLTQEEGPRGERIQKLDYFTIDRYFMGQNGFGWIPEISNRHRVRPGQHLDKETVITHSAAVKGDQYCLGTNLNIAFGSFVETVEDAFLISESAARKMQTQQVSQVLINCRMDRRPLYLNGPDKFLPDIGEYVRPDGALCASRPVHWTTHVADSDPESLREPLPNQDDIIYIEPGSKILDKTYNINRGKLASSSNCYEQARLYELSNTRCWEDIYRTYISLKGKYLLTPKMSTLVTTAIYRMIAQGTHIPALNEEFRKVMRNYDIEGANGQPVDFMQIIVTYAVPRPVSNGSKLTDQAGAKGVVGRVVPDDWMPVDEYGIRADMCIDMNSPVGRNNPGQLYETGFNRIGEFVRRRIKEVYETLGSDPAFDIAIDWYNDANPNYARIVMEECNTPKLRLTHVKEAIEHGVRVWLPPFIDTLVPSKEDFWNALTNMKKWAEKWNVRSTPVRFKTMQADGSVKEFVTKEHFSIGSKYVLHLHKIPEITAPGPAAVNHMGIPTKSAGDSKYFPVSNNPYRYGEDELRVMAMDSPIREVTRFQNLMANSPTGVNETIRAILLSEHSTRIKRTPISNGKLMSTSAVLQVFHNTAAVLGFETKTTKIDSFEVPDELADAIWKTDIVDSKNAQVKMFEDDEIVTNKAAVKKSKVKKMMDLLLPDDDDDIGELADSGEDDDG